MTARRMEERVKELANSFTNYLYVLKSAQNGGNYESEIGTNQSRSNP